MRRPIITLVLAFAMLAGSAPAIADDTGLDLTILATTDVHGHALDWDYFAEAPADIPEDVAGLSLLGTVINQIRERAGHESVIVVDDGDAIQGTPLTEMYGKGAPEAAGLAEHPMATAFNLLGYDALVTGNHEFDYGLDLLNRYRDQLDGTLLAANVVEKVSGDPVLPPYTVITRTIAGHTVRVGILGLATPAMNTYQADQMPGLEITDIVTAGEKWVPIVAQQSDVVVVLAHSGQGTVPDAEYWQKSPVEDAVSNLARMVPGIDVIVQGHTHRDAPRQVYTNSAGGQVLVTQPYYWARSLSEVSLHLIGDGDGWRVDWSEANAPRVTPHYAHQVDEPDAALVAALAPAHEAALAYVKRIYEPVAPSTELIRSRTSRYEDTPILDFVNRAQTDAVQDALVGTEWADLPVLSATSPFSRTAAFPMGMVTTGHILGLYPYYNTLDAVVLTGAELKDYLEQSARFFVQVPQGGEFDPATGTNANGMGDYTYDVISGVRYQIDISKDPGNRIQGLEHLDGTPITAGEEFVLALNNFRHTGAGGYPHVADAPVVYRGDTDVRDILADWARARGVIDPADFFNLNWSLRTEPLPEVTPSATPTPTPTPSPKPTGPTNPGRPGLPSTGAIGD